MISLDTNVVLRFLLDDIPEQTIKATKLIQNNQVYMTDVVAVEVIYVLEKVILLPRADIFTLMTDFLGFANVVYNPNFLLTAIKFYKNHPALSIVDCYASVEAGAYDSQLATFDKRLANQGGKHIKKL